MDQAGNKYDVTVTYHSGSPYPAYIDVIVNANGLTLRSYVSAQQNGKFVTYVHAFNPKNGSKISMPRNVRVGAPCPAPLILRVDTVSREEAEEKHRRDRKRDDLLRGISGSAYSTERNVLVVLLRQSASLERSRCPSQQWRCSLPKSARYSRSTIAAVARVALRKHRSCFCENLGREDSEESSLTQVQLFFLNHRTICLSHT